jgi:iron-sulfur cluster repair protein YtfE (RIC family)
LVVHTTMYLEYHTVVFCCGGEVLLRPEIQTGCAVVSVFGSGGKWVLVVHTTIYLEYHTVVFCCGGKVLL